MIVAQAPPPEIAVRDEVDVEGKKFQVPNDKLRKSRTEEQRIRLDARAVLANQKSLAEPATRLSFHGFYRAYLFPMMTTEEGLRTIGKERQDFLRDLMMSKNPDAHKEVVEFTIPAMQKIVQDKEYRPQARYNAMLILSSLNDVEPVSLGTTSTLPEPAKAALPIILQQYKNSDRDEIKLAALLGLARHLEFDNYKQTPMPPAGRAAIIKELTTLAESKEPPAGREADVHLWMRRRAVEGLAAACLTKVDAEIAALMDRLLRDESDATSLRLAVATALGRMSLQAPAKIDAVATAKELGYLALKACDVELTRAETYRKAELEHQARLAGSYQGDTEYSSGPGGMPGSIGRMSGGESPGGMRAPLRPTGAPGMSSDGYGSESGGMDPSMQDPKHFEVEYLRRRLRQNLYAVQFGLLGGDDHPPPKATPSPTTPTPTTTATKGGEEKKDRGIYAVAKTPQEKKEVDLVYWAVRKLAETVEIDGADIDFYQLIKDGRRDLKPLEAIVGRRAPPPTATDSSDDAPTVGKAKGAKGPPGKAVPGKAVPGKATPRPAMPGKAAVKPASRPQSGVFAQPRFGK
jgi:hypothetical protein